MRGPAVGHGWGSAVSRGGPKRPERGTTRRFGARALTRLATIVLVGAGGAAIWWPLRYSLPGPLGSAALPAPREAPPVSHVSRADFVGAERCQTCHQSEYEAWRISTHGRAGGAPSTDVVIAAFNGRPIRFRDAVVTPRVRAGVYEFVVARDDDEPEVVRVDGVIGRGHMEGGGTQGFVTRRPDGTVRFLPFDWSRHGAFWFCNTNSRTGRGWVPITDGMRLAECGDWPPIRVLGDVTRWANCQGCHASQVAVEDSAGARVTRFTSLAINCESCHGPARRHVELAERGALAASADVGLVALRTLDKDGSLRVCYRCHSVKDQLREGYLPGDPLEQFYSLRLPGLGDRPLHADGRVRTFAYQEAHSYSDCYLSGGMTCTACHDPHSQAYRTVAEVPLSGRFDDAQCTSCHASKAERVREHTHHVASSAGSRCTSCHMPYRQEPETMDPRTGRAPVRYTRSDHSIAIPRPRADSALGVESSCAQCHRNFSTARLEAQVAVWWGELKVPTHRTGLRNSAATFDSVARVLEAAAGPDRGVSGTDRVEWLDRLSRDPDVDVRAIALATLHLTGGEDRAVRRVITRAAARAGARDFGLRARWSIALGYMADRFAGAGDLASALTAYTRALEVTPSNPRILLSLGNAQRAAGDHRAAIASYEAALVAEPASGLTMVNLGITLGLVGDSARGEAMFRRAAEADRGEPLAWFNLGNVLLLRGDLPGAASAFRRAVAVDASLHEAHFRLARIHLLQRDARAALQALRRGLALDSTNSAARDLVRELARPGRN